MLTVFDSGFCGSDLYSTITTTGAQVIMRAGAQFDLTPITVLADGSYTAHLKKGGPLVRVIEYTVYTETDAESAQGHQSTIGETITLVTSLLGVDRYPLEDFPGLYAARWEAEILYDAVKTELRGGTTALNASRRSVHQTGRRFPSEYLAALDVWAFGELMDDLLPPRRCRSAPRQVTRRSFRFPTRKRTTPASSRTRHRIHIRRLIPPAQTP